MYVCICVSHLIGSYIWKFSTFWPLHFSKLVALSVSSFPRIFIAAHSSVQWHFSTVWQLRWQLAAGNLAGGFWAKLLYTNFWWSPWILNGLGIRTASGAGTGTGTCTGTVTGNWVKLVCVSVSRIVINFNF